MNKPTNQSRNKPIPFWSRTKTKIKGKKRKVLHNIDLFLDNFRRNTSFKYEVGDRVFVNDPEHPFGEIIRREKVRPHMNRYRVKADNDVSGGHMDLPEGHILSKHPKLNNP